MKYLGDRIRIPRMALNMAGIYINDMQTDLMLRVLAKVEHRKELMNIKDVCKCEREHEKEWKEYEQYQREQEEHV